MCSRWMPMAAVLGLGMCLFSPVWLLAQTPKTSPKPHGAAAAGTKKSALDKTAMEEYVRHLFVWGPQIQVKIADPKPSELPGFNLISVVASAGPASQEELFYVSKDGQKIVRGMI